MSNTLEYKWLIGTVEYNWDDRVFYWKISMIDDLVTFEAMSVDELERNFKESVDDYLETCKKLWRNPQKAFKWVFNLRISWDLHKKAYKEALKENISLNKFVERSIEKQLGS